MSNAIRTFILCADDYAQSESISEAILTLIQHQRLNAFSALSHSPLWPEHAQKARTIHAQYPQVQVGLHFCLTPYRHDRSTEYASLNTALLRSLLGRINSDRVLYLLQQQWDQFTDHAGMAPRFIDGHHHIQHLPAVFEALVRFYSTLSDPKPYLRLAPQTIQWHRPGAWKHAVLQVLSGSKLHQRCLAHAIPFTADFGGFYQPNGTDPRPIFQNLFQNIQSGGLIMCHPGTTSGEPHDLMAQGRREEFEYLMSPALLEDWAQAKVALI